MECLNAGSAYQSCGISYVSPAQRNPGKDQAILAAQHDLYTSLWELHPARWSGKNRSWAKIDTVTLNLELDQISNTLSACTDKHLLAA